MLRNIPFGVQREAAAAVVRREAAAAVAMSAGSSPEPRGTKIANKTRKTRSYCAVRTPPLPHAVHRVSRVGAVSSWVL